MKHNEHRKNRNIRLQKQSLKKEFEFKNPLFECNVAPIMHSRILEKWLECNVAPKTSVYAFTMHPKWLNLTAMLHPRKISRKDFKKCECKSASKSPDYAPTMHPNTPFLSATMHPSHNFMIFRGFRGNFPLIRCTFSTLSNKVRIWQKLSEGFSGVISPKYLTDEKKFLKNGVDAMLHPNDDFKVIFFKREVIDPLD